MREIHGGLEKEKSGSDDGVDQTSFQKDTALYDENDTLDKLFLVIFETMFADEIKFLKQLSSFAFGRAVDVPRIRSQRAPSRQEADSIHDT
jgi:hypothetical protein